MNRPFIVDAHLDLAWNHQLGRDVTQPAATQPTLENEIATVGLPDLRAGNVGLICATLFALPKLKDRDGYTDHTGAAETASTQLRTYSQWRDAGEIHIVRSTDDLEIEGLKAIVLMEGGDPLAFAEESAQSTPAAWFGRGVRMVGLAWRRTRWTGGTGDPGPLTDDGQRLVPLLDEAGLIHDASHLAEAALDELFDLAEGPLCASHSNCRAIVGDDPTGRHLPDRQIKAIAERSGVIGLNVFDKFVMPSTDLKARRMMLCDVVRHVRHVCDLVGDALHVGLGTDMDGGLGQDHIPLEIRSSADLPKFGDALADDDFSDTDIAAFLGGNWLRFFRESLPSNA